MHSHACILLIGNLGMNPRRASQIPPEPTRSGPDCSRWPAIQPTAFSLIEVTLSLGIVAFALVALFGLLSNGLSLSQGARNEMLAAQIASSILAERRAAPDATLANNPLPPLTASTNGLQSTDLDRAGRPTTSDPYFTLIYEVAPLDASNPLESRAVRVFLALAHPARSSGGSFATLAKAEGTFETTTYVRLPDPS